MYIPACFERNVDRFTAEIRGKGVGTWTVLSGLSTFSLEKEMKTLV